MTSLSITCRRTLSRARNLMTTSFLVSLFLAASLAVFAFRLADAEGSRETFATLWTTSVSLVLPILAAFLASDIWSEERRTLRLDMLLSVAVSERDLVLGKVLGLFILLMVATFLSLVAALASLAAFAPRVLAGVDLFVLLPGLFALVLESAVLASAATAVSAVFARPFAAALTSLALLVALPRALWAAARLWSKSPATAFGEMPLDAAVSDFSSGLLSTGPLVAAVLLVLFCLFFATKVIRLARFANRRLSRASLSTVLAFFLAFVSTVSVSALAFRFDAVFDVASDARETLSPRMRAILSDASGRVVVTAFLPRTSPSYRAVARALRALKHQADALSTLSIKLQFVDPAWDLGAAERLVRLGVKENAIVFEKAHRVTTLSLEEPLTSRALVEALRSCVLPPQRREIYWTTGHGEASADDYGPWGMSDIRRELARNGYSCRTLDLAADGTIPPDCALIVVAGARETFSRAEWGRLDAYLRGGGRLLVLAGASAEEGVLPLLPAWGLHAALTPIKDARSTSGTDVIVTDFSDHAVSQNLLSSRLVLERPVSFEPSAVVRTSSGADHLVFTPIAKVGASVVVAAVERGGGVGRDIAVRPTRLVAVGDASFVSNGALASRGSANVAFFLNAVSFLAGAECVEVAENDASVLVTGLDRAARGRLFAVLVGAIPLGVFAFLSLIVIRRRLRT